MTEQLADASARIDGIRQLETVVNAMKGIVAARGLHPVWSAPISSHTSGIAKLADTIAKAIYRALGEGRLERMGMIHAGWESGQPRINWQVLLPVDLSDLPPPGATGPLAQLPTNALINSLRRDYLHALVCKAARYAFAAENEARTGAMSVAGSQITREQGTGTASVRGAS